MDYNKHYNLLIERAKNRILGGYTESHHILPKCLGGTDSPENLVLLTAEEHFVAHQLLVKMYPENPANAKLLWAISAMRNTTGVMVRNNKMYGWLRRRFAEMISKASKGRTASAETREKQRLAKLGKKRGPHTEETKKKMSLASKGRPKSEAHKLSMSKSRCGKSRSPHSEETKLKMSAIQKEIANKIDRSYSQTEEYKRKQSENMKRIWEERNRIKNGIVQ